MVKSSVHKGGVSGYRSLLSGGVIQEEYLSAPQCPRVGFIAEEETIVAQSTRM